MATVLADQSLYEFTGGRPLTVGELASRYQLQTAGPGTPGEAWCNWIIRVGTQERAVGFVQATVVGDLADLAWVLGVLEHGRGFATEAVMAVRDWLAENKVRQIEAHIHPRHEASQAVAQRIGMARTGDCDDEDEEIWAAELDVTSHRASAAYRHAESLPTRQVGKGLAGRRQRVTIHRSVGWLGFHTECCPTEPTGEVTAHHAAKRESSEDRG